MSTLIVIAGPTASGKTALSLEVAHAFDAEIISADSRQFYRRMNIGTAKPTPEEQAAVHHHFIDILDPTDEYSSGRFAAEASAFLETYFYGKDTAVMVGGSGLYINAVTQGFDDLPPTPPEVREKWSSFYSNHGLEGLQHALRDADPVYAREVDLENPQRLQRALEAMEVSGQPVSALRKRQGNRPPFEVVNIALMPERQHLYERINLRVDRMMELGLLEEVRSLLPLKSCNALQTVGYQELIDHLEGGMSLNEAVDKIKQHTRNYAKRQYTWFKKQSGYSFFENYQPEGIIKHLKQKARV